MRKFERKDLEQFAEGREKFVASHPEEEGKLVSFLKDKESPRFLKACFYLTKIGHMLLPQNIPDIYGAGGTEDQMVVVEKKELDEGHKKLRDNVVQFLKTGFADYSIGEERDEQVRNDPAYKDLGAVLRNLGLEYDPGIQNFGKDEQGNMVYVDTLYPWNWKSIKGKQSGEIVKSYDKSKLEFAIAGLPKDQQKIALGYLDRLEKLFEEESGYKEMPAAA